EGNHALSRLGGATINPFAPRWIAPGISQCTEGASLGRIFAAETKTGTSSGLPRRGGSAAPLQQLSRGLQPCGPSGSPPHPPFLVIQEARRPLRIQQTSKPRLLQSAYAGDRFRHCRERSRLSCPRSVGCTRPSTCRRRRSYRWPLS